MSGQEKVVLKGISMYPIDWAAVDAFAKDQGLSRSAALRMIVRQWLDSERQRIGMRPVGGNGQAVADA